ncbi:MAG: dihydroorotate dehydrogenase [Bacillota bacterium]|jgi:dihydroorotate dehydrogenase (NAD+) catalytic subunit
MRTPDLSVSIGALHLENPVLTASGTFGYGLEFMPYGDLSQLGGVVVKGTTLEPRAGNPPQRVVETASGMLNSIGLENPGVEYFLQRYLPQLQQRQVTTIVNMSGNTVDEYCRLTERLQQPGIVALELNISCPNVKAGGMAFGTDPKLAAEVVRAVKPLTRLPLIVKLSPNVTDIVEMARVVEDAGADAISLINTFVGMAVDVRRRRPILGNIIGGLSGPAIKPLALRMVWQVSRAVQVPVIGLGGIMNAEDALEFIICGASAVQIGTANLVNPDTAWRVIDGIRQFCLNEGVASVQELIGTLRT